jgi:uncharacterized protein YkwD
MTAVTRTARRATLLTIALIAVMLATVGADPAGAQGGYDGGAEAEFVASINQLRASKGLSALTLDGQLVGSSRVWTDQMKTDGSISHAPDLSVGVTQNWQKLGENVGVGPTVTALMDAFIASPGHYANLVDPVYTRVGVGVVWDGNVMYTTHRFMSVAAAASPPPATDPPPTLPPPVLPAATPDPPTPPTTATPKPPPPTTAPAPSSMASSSSVSAMLDALTAAGG